MSAVHFFNDVEYLTWLAAHPDGFVVNTPRHMPPDNMVLHRARCAFIRDGSHEKAPGGFTERDYTKVGAETVQDLRTWVSRHGRPDGSFTSECSHCRPVDDGSARDTRGQGREASKQPPEVKQLVNVELAGAGIDSAAKPTWQLWKRGKTVHAVDGFTPLVASWNRSTDPAQARLRAYLEDITPRLLPLPEDVPLFLHLDVDVEDPRRLERDYDLENYLTPLFGAQWLPAKRFSLVSARKFVGGGSRIACGVATSEPAGDEDGWSAAKWRQAGAPASECGRNGCGKGWRRSACFPYPTGRRGCGSRADARRGGTGRACGSRPAMRWVPCSG